MGSLFFNKQTIFEKSSFSYAYITNFTEKSINPTAAVPAPLWCTAVVVLVVQAPTYYSIDLVLGRMNKGAREIDIAATLEHLRDQRAGLVATRQQFEFVLMAVAEEVHAILKALPANTSNDKKDVEPRETGVLKEEEEAASATTSAEAPAAETTVKTNDEKEKETSSASAGKEKESAKQTPVKQTSKTEAKKK